MRKAILAAGLAVIGWQTAAGAVEVKTVVDAQLMGGQNYFDGSESSFGGVAGLTVSPYTKFNDQWSLVPLYSGHYQGTKQVTDLVGGGTLFQDSQDHTVSVKGIRTFSHGWKAKAVTGYGTEFLRETKDEDWGSGLYDNRRLFAGTEGEWSWAEDRFLRFAYDFYKISFSNYQSLESSQVDNGLGRELSAPDVLDNDNHSFSLGTRLKLPGRGYTDLNAGYTLRAYKDQHLVVASGDLISDTRQDSVQTIGAVATWPISINRVNRLFTSVGYSWSHLYSNQNNFDADQLVYNPNFYAYVTQTATNQWTLLLGDKKNPWSLNLNGAVTRQQYADRPVQDASGVYGTDDTHVDSVYVGLGASYPIAKGFHLAANAYFGWNDSNNQYDLAYQYHYSAQTYLMGFTYAY